MKTAVVKLPEKFDNNRIIRKTPKLTIIENKGT